MPIAKGEPWGSVGPVPADVVEVADDRALALLVAGHRAAGTEVPPVFLRGGSLLRAVGGSGDPARLTGDVARLPTDIVRVESAGHTAWFAGHLIARLPWHRGGWWRGEVVAAMNGQFAGRWDIAPRAHPGDAKVDIVHVAAAMRPRERWRAGRRLPTATHVPHPQITVRQRAQHDLVFAQPLVVLLDGAVWQRCRELRLTVEPDAVLLCV